MYSHDGLRDSLTNLAAPTLFYEALRRELSRVSRSGDQLSLVRFLLAPDQLADERPAAQIDDREVLKFSEILAQLSREEELCARMGELEFVSVLHGPSLVAQSFILRISDAWADNEENMYLASSHVTALLGEESLALLNRLDSEHLSQQNHK